MDLIIIVFEKEGALKSQGLSSFAGEQANSKNINEINCFILFL
jgi:hypothetical protein